MKTFMAAVISSCLLFELTIAQSESAKRKLIDDELTAYWKNRARESPTGPVNIKVAGQDGKCIATRELPWTPKEEKEQAP